MALAIDATATGTKQGMKSGASVVSSAITTTGTNRLLLALVSYGGGVSNSHTSGVTLSSVTGAGLTWTFVVRANTQSGTAEIWRAFATSVITAQTVTAATTGGTMGGGSIAVVAFSGADTSGTNGSGAIGATNTANGASGAQTCSLTTTRNGSWVLGCGVDWDNGTARTLGSGQTSLVQFVDTSDGDTEWAQRQTSATTSSGTVVTINDTAPTGDEWNLAIVEVLAAAGTTFTSTQNAALSTFLGATTFGRVLKNSQNAGMGKLIGATARQDGKAIPAVSFPIAAKYAGSTGKVISVPYPPFSATAIRGTSRAFLGTAIKSTGAFSKTPGKSHQAAATTYAVTYSKTPGKAVASSIAAWSTSMARAVSHGISGSIASFTVSIQGLRALLYSLAGALFTFAGPVQRNVGKSENATTQAASSSLTRAISFGLSGLTTFAATIGTGSAVILSYALSAVMAVFAGRSSQTPGKSLSASSAVGKGSTSQAIGKALAAVEAPASGTVAKNPTRMMAAVFAAAAGTAAFLQAKLVSLFAGTADWGMTLTRDIAFGVRSQMGFSGKTTTAALLHYALSAVSNLWDGVVSTSSGAIFALMEAGMDFFSAFTNQAITTGTNASTAPFPANTSKLFPLVTFMAQTAGAAGTTAKAVAKQLTARLVIAAAFADFIRTIIFVTMAEWVAMAGTASLDTSKAIAATTALGLAAFSKSAGKTVSASFQNAAAAVSLQTAKVFNVAITFTASFSGLRIFTRLLDASAALFSAATLRTANKSLQAVATTGAGLASKTLNLQAIAAVLQTAAGAITNGISRILTAQTQGPLGQVNNATAKDVEAVGPVLAANTSQRTGKAMTAVGPVFSGMANRGWASGASATLVTLAGAVSKNANRNIKAALVKFKGPLSKIQALHREFDALAKAFSVATTRVVAKGMTATVLPGAVTSARTVAKAFPVQLKAFTVSGSRAIFKPIAAARADWATSETSGKGIVARTFSAAAVAFSALQIKAPAKSVQASLPPIVVATSRSVSKQLGAACVAFGGFVQRTFNRSFNGTMQPLKMVTAMAHVVERSFNAALDGFRAQFASKKDSTRKPNPRRPGWF